jgi:hypothetical protein
MKRGAPLQRHTALTARTPLSPGDKPLARRKPLRPSGTPVAVPHIDFETPTGNPQVKMHTGYGLSRIGFPERKPRKDTGSQQKPFPLPVRALLDARDISLLDMERCCQMCAATENLERHHRRGKGMGGSQGRPHAQCACNGVVLCRRHHRWVHRAGRREAEAEGFIVSQAEDFPGSVSVMRFAEAGGGASQFPSCDGRWLDEAEIGAAA